MFSMSNGGFIHLHCINYAFLFPCLYAANQRIVWNAMQHSVRFKILYLFLWWVICVQVPWMQQCFLIILCVWRMWRIVLQT